jgi:hypothetical protein
MEAIPSYQSQAHLKRLVKPIKVKNKLASNSQSTNKARKGDPVHFVDFPYVMDYTSWLEPTIDPSIQLAVKGPISQLTYIIERMDNGEIVTKTRPFSSPANAEIPIILPDYSSNYFKNQKKVTSSQEDEDDMAAVENIYAMNDLDDHHENTAAEVDHNSNNQLGLKAFYLINTETRLPFNISEGILDPADLKMADFAEDQRAQHCYRYANSVLNSDEYREDKKEEVRQWLKEMPPEPVDKKQGFPKGSAANCFPVSHNRLQRIIELCKTLRRPDPSEYLKYEQHSGSLAQQSLPCIRHRPLACNADTSGEAHINRAIMMAMAQNSVEEAKKAVILEYLQKKKEKAKVVKTMKATKVAKASRAIPAKTKKYCRRLTSVSSSESNSKSKIDTKARETKENQNFEDAKECSEQEHEDADEEEQGDDIEEEDEEDDDEEDDDEEEDEEDENEDKKDNQDQLNDGYWTSLTLQAASTKKFNQLHISTSTTLVLNCSMIQLKSEVYLKGIPNKAHGIVIDDKQSGRCRMLTIRFINNETRVISHSQVFLLQEIL